MIGKTISHYKILEKLGAGGMGVVYQAEDTKLKRTVALKFLPPALSTDKESKTRFIHEARAASALDHPNICTIHEIGETDDGQSYIAMACYDGESLKDQLESTRQQGGGLPVEESISTTIQIAKGLARAHEEGIVHRDIKPANIMITDRGEVKILDFGLAKLAGQTQLTKSGTTLGTVAYMSPEQAGGKESDQRSDIWSLGVVLYEMLTGRNPFQAEFEQAMIYSIMNEPHQPIDGNGNMPDELKAIIDKSLTKDPTERYQSIEELLQDFEPLSPIAALPPEESLKKIFRKIWRRKKRPIMAIATFVVLIGLAWVFSPYLMPGEPEGPMEIAVVSFENMTGEPDNENLANIIPNLLMTDLNQSEHLRMLDWDYLRDILKQLDIRDVKTIDRDLGLRICKQANIAALITGSFAKVGDSYVTDVKTINPETKEIIVSASARGQGSQSILYQQIGKLSAAIIEGLGVEDASYLADKKQVYEITSPSLKALHYYERAKWGATPGIDNEQKLRLLKRAVELDSTFAAAYLALAQAYYGDQPDKEREAITKAYHFADHAPDNGIRDEIYAHYAAAVEEDTEKMIRCVEAGQKKNPYNKRLWYWSNMIHRWNDNYYEQINDCEKVLAIDPEDGVALNFGAYSYAYVGDKEKALEYINRYSNVNPGHPNNLDTAGDIYFILGMLDEAMEQYKELRVVYPTKEWIHPAQFQIANIHILKQNYDRARIELDKYLTEVPPTPNEKSYVHLYRTLFFYFMGEISHAFSEIDSILTNKEVHHGFAATAIEFKGYLSLNQNNISNAQKAFLKRSTNLRMPKSYHINKAMVCLAQGQTDSCQFYIDQAQLLIDEANRAIDRNFKPLWLRMMPMYCGLLRAELLLQADSTDQAIDTYNHMNFAVGEIITGVYANCYYNIPLEKDIVPRALVKKGDIEGAIEAYEKMTDFQVDQKDRFFINPKYHYRLARLYQQDGQRQKAIERYKRFLDIWKYADKGLPEKVDAERRLANLVDGG